MQSHSQTRPQTHLRPDYGRPRHVMLPLEFSIDRRGIHYHAYSPEGEQVIIPHRVQVHLRERFGPHIPHLPEFEALVHYIDHGRRLIAKLWLDNRWPSTTPRPRFEYWERRQPQRPMNTQNRKKNPRHRRV